MLSILLAVLLCYYIFFLFFFILLRFTSSSLQFYCFVGFTLFTFTISFFYSLLAHLLFFIIGRHDLAQLTTSYFCWYLTAPVTGLNVKVEHEERLKGWGGYNGPCVLVANHQSELDILLMARLWQRHTVACSTWRVKSMPLLGLYARLCRTIFVDPPKTYSLTNKKILIDAANMIRSERKNIWIFPEGVRSYSSKAELLPLKRGAFVLAREAGNIPIVPIVIGNMAHVFDSRKRIYQAGVIRVRILEAINTRRDGEPKESIDIDQLLPEVEKRMLQALNEISD